MKIRVSSLSDQPWAASPGTQFSLPIRALPLIVATLLLVLPAPSLAVHLGKMVAFFVLFAINARWGEPRIWYAFVLFLVVMMVSLIPALHTWNAVVVPATGFALAALLRPHWLAADRWLTRGHASTATWVLLALTVPLSAGALLAWAEITQPSLTVYAGMIPGSGIGIVVVAALVFSLFNAIAEEVVFRGVIWQALSDSGFASGIVLIITALAFGVFHLHGVPSGLPGVALASIYGLALGGIRMFSKGLLMPIVAHVFADLTIFMVVMRLAERW